MGVFADEENLSHTIRQQITSPGMHWQQHQHERYVGPAYDPSRDLSPNLPACDATASSMGSSSGPNTNNSDNNEPPGAIVKVSGSLCSTPSGSSNSSSTSSSTSSSSSSSTSSGSACSTPSHNNNNNNIQCHQNNPSNNNNNNNSTCALSSSEMCRISSSHDYHNQHFPPIQIPKLEPVTTPPPPMLNRTSYGQNNSVNDVLSASSGDVDDDNIRTRNSTTLSGHCKNNNNSPLATICAGCGQLISDRFYLQAVDRRWHAACLQCCQCRHTLDGEVTCFSRNGNIYCKKDYYRLFGMKRCARCQASILSTELVMRARDLVFHVHCFTCEICNAPLTKGDHFGMRDAAVLCRLHYEMSSHHESSSPAGMISQIRGGGLIPPPSSGGPLGGCQSHGVLIPGQSPSSVIHPNTVPPPPGSGSLHHYPPSFPSPSDFHHNMSPGGGGSGHHPHISPSPQLTSQPPPPGSMGDTNKVPSFYNGAPTSTPRQKGRPRKRKPKDIESMTANLDINSDYLDMPFGRSPGTPGMHGSSSRTKRMRTSFKHHQLRTMKSYFAVNHNPDAKDLKQLSQKTGLPKRVLQVWFQNARAKWRRMMQKQEGKSGDKCSGSESGGINDLDLYPHGGPGSLTGSIQSLPPHSPQFLLGPGSPNSLDCT